MKRNPFLWFFLGVTVISVIGATFIVQVPNLNIWTNGTARIITAGSYQSFQGTLTHAGTVTLNFAATNAVNALSLTGNVTFATSNLATNRTYRLKITGTSTNATPTFPAWNFLGGAPPTFTASKVGMLSLEAWGATDGTVVAAYAESQ